MTTRTLTKAVERVEALPANQREAWTRAAGAASARGPLGVAARAALRDVPPDLRRDLEAFAEWRYQAEAFHERAVRRLFAELERRARRTARGGGLLGEVELVRAEAQAAAEAAELLSRERRRSARRAGA